MSGHRLRGFNYLGPGDDALDLRTVLRLALLGALLGALLAWAWMQASRDELEALRLRQQQLQAQVQALEPALRESGEQLRELAAQQVEVTRLKNWQVHRLQLLRSLEALAASSGAQILHLRYDDRFLSLQGRLPATQLQAWSQALRPALSELGLAELVEVAAQAEPLSQADPVRFVLRWPLPAQRP